MGKPIRIGHSIDVHKFTDSRKLILGGVNIDFLGLEGHSDADVLLHAVAESILGALALGDLGSNFPDTDEAYKNIDSSLLVTHAVELAKQKGYKVGNIDCVVLAERPKLAPHIYAMREHIASLLEVDINQVSVKATTTEGLGFIGRIEGIASTSTVLMEGM